MHKIRTGLKFTSYDGDRFQLADATLEMKQADPQRGVVISSGKDEIELQEMLEQSVPVRTESTF
jgi:hypothetical protein